MPTLSVSVPGELRKKMHQLDEVNWSAVARKAFEDKVSEMLFLKSLAAKSKLTEKDVQELSDKVNRAAAEKFLKLKPHEASN